MRSTWLALTNLTLGLGMLAEPSHVLAANRAARDTILVQVATASRGCVYVDHVPIPGPPFVVSEAFECGADTISLGLVINDDTPQFKRVPEKWRAELTPRLVRRMQEIWAHAGRRAGQGLRGPNGVARRLAAWLADSSAAVVEASVDTSRFDTNVIVRWKDDPRPWTLQLDLGELTPIVVEPWSPAIRALEYGRTVAWSLQRGGRFEIESTGMIVWTHGCPREGERR